MVSLAKLVLYNSRFAPKSHIFLARFMLFIEKVENKILSEYHLILLFRVDSSTLTLWSGPFPIKDVPGKFLLL